MKKRNAVIALLALLMLAGCGSGNESSSAETTTTTTTTTAAASADESVESEDASSEDASSDDTSSEEKVLAPQEEVGYEGMTPVTADQLKDGVYHIAVDSSSSMFKINDCELTVADGKMTAKLYMNGTGYEYLFMGTEEEAQASAEADRIPYVEEGEVHTFTVPVEALDKEINCAAFSKRKETWYGRVLVFRADSLSADSFAEGASSVITPEAAGLKEGEYEINVTLEGGSGKATVASPCKVTVGADGSITAHIVWSSDKYDYMIVDGEKYLPVTTEGGSTFDIPVLGFNYKMPVKADTTAMSTAHEIDYTLFFELDV
ncbi:hypothetical protein SAMN02910447_01720 [Ruminococcus sp. YE71]|uniref:hypothetical protein n=1 Tax=unclassified Ruminococcus TaxID=2608920 RepID=UPI00087EE9CE|nr:MULTISPECIES: hypothetical protein [unclassified Ruminococcus]SDA20230.1 hypothetical protein SAMN02910446_01721 [Ruminococcus sp. YE78]SFW32075.1 hypothetical protein SAMN02910447_01720 [Ruminococcus sp. YE71]